MAKKNKGKLKLLSKCAMCDDKNQDLSKARG